MSQFSLSFSLLTRFSFQYYCRGVIHRQHNSAERFLDYFEEAVDRYSATGKLISLLGNVNLNILRAQTCNYAQQFLDALLPTINKPRRVYNNSASLMDNIFTKT